MESPVLIETYSSTHVLSILSYIQPFQANHGASSSYLKFKFAKLQRSEIHFQSITQPFFTLNSLLNLHLVGFDLKIYFIILILR